MATPSSTDWNNLEYLYQVSVKTTIDPTLAVKFSWSDESLQYFVTPQHFDCIQLWVFWCVVSCSDEVWHFLVIPQHSHWVCEYFDHNTLTMSQCGCFDLNNPTMSHCGCFADGVVLVWWSHTVSAWTLVPVFLPWTKLQKSSKTTFPWSS